MSTEAEDLVYILEARLGAFILTGNGPTEPEGRTKYERKQIAQGTRIVVAMPLKMASSGHEG